MTQPLIPDHDQMYQELANEILRFDLKPGDLLSEHSLCERFHVRARPPGAFYSGFRKTGWCRLCPIRAALLPG